MHVILTKEEFETRIRNNFSFCEGDTFVVNDFPSKEDIENDNMLSSHIAIPLRRYCYTDEKGLHLEVDFIQLNKKATPEDYSKVEALSDDEIIQWYFDYAERADTECPYSEYQVYVDEFNKRFEFIYSIKTFCSYDGKKIHTALNLMCDQTRSFEEHLAELERFLPYCKFVELDKDIEDSIHLSIFEHTLSEHGIYDAYIGKSGQCSIWFTRYGRPKLEKKFDDYKEMLAYLIENHPYRLKNEEGDKEYLEDEDL